MRISSWDHPRPQPHSDHHRSRYPTLVLLASLLLPGACRAADSIVFPVAAGAINVKTQFGAKGDGVTDDTAAIQTAIDETKGKPNTLYFPDGVYLLSDRVGMVGGKAHSSDRFLAYQGQSEQGTILKVMDNCPAFQNAAQPREVFSVYNGGSTGDCMHAYFNDMTVDTGTGNAGASGVRFFSNNTGGMRHVTIKSSDPKRVGGTGLDLTQGQIGPAFIKNVTVIGFDTAIAMDSAFSMVFEHITLMHQNKLGISCMPRIAMRGLLSDNSVPVIRMASGWATLALVDSTFKGGSPDVAAILSNDKPAVYLRNVKQSGYAALVKDSKGKLINLPGVAEWSENGIGAFGQMGAGLMLPVKETPDIPWETDMAKWEMVASGADTAGVQKSFDNAAKDKKTTVCFPSGQSVKLDGPIRVRGSVSRIVGMESIVDISDPSGVFKGNQAVFTFEELTSEALVVERFFILGGWKCPGYIKLFENKTNKRFVMRNMGHNGAARIPGGGGEFYIEDVSPGRNGTLLVGKGENVWLRQFNPESPDLTMVEVDGGTVWWLGLKTEGSTTHVSATNGARVEILGGASYQSWDDQKFDPPMFKSINSDVFYSIGFYWHSLPFSTIVEETRGGKTQTLPKEQLLGTFRTYSK